MPMDKYANCGTLQVRNQGRRGAKPHLQNFSPPLEKSVRHSWKLLDIVWKIWALFRKLFANPGVPSWLRAWHLVPKVCNLSRKPWKVREALVMSFSTTTNWT